MHYESIDRLSQRIRDRDVSPVDVVEACLRRVETLNPTLNAFITVIGSAREQARAAEAEIRAGKWRGPLHGIPVGVKDFFDTAGVRTTGGVAQFKERVPDSDAEVVRKLKRAGAIIVGKTNMDALGMATTGLTSCFGPVHNPWNDDYVSGGSSAGSACAIAAGLCYATVDTDAVGSVRLPAACCGVVGFKGSHGLISVKGILGDEPVDDFIRWMGHVGITTRSALDAALMLNALADPEGQDFASAIGKADRNVRVGVGRNFTLDAGIRQAFDSAVTVLADLGYEVSDADVPFGDSSQASMKNIKRDRAGIAGAAFAKADVIVLTTLQTSVPSVKEAAKDAKQGVSSEITAFANYHGLPAVSVPCGFDSRGLPIGVQIVGRPAEERTVLNVAHHYERAANVGDKHPMTVRDM
jgi:aspartyl-tRNA(Asn)/glutamyl-tRNA(Gln) amidotransferase subunit A